MGFAPGSILKNRRFTMAIIRPFMAVRPSVEKAEKIAALPYDVYNRAEACEVVKNNPDSFLKIDRAETQFDDSVGTYDDIVYDKARDTLNEMIEKGDFIQDDKPCYYLYELTMDGRAQTGIVACASIDDYENNIIKKHENTRAEKEADRIRHVDTCSAQTGPIFLAYRQNDVLKGIVSDVKSKEPMYDFTADDGIRHRAWIIDGTEDIAAIEKAFAGIDSIYIADGHHRCASAVRVGQKRRSENPGYDGSEEFNFFLSVLFPDEELKILDYNRVVKDMNGLSAGEVLEKAGEIFEVEKTDKSASDGVSPNNKGEVSMYLDGSWYFMKLKSEYKNDDPVKGLDVALLQDLFLEPVFGIKDPKTDPRIDFVGGIRGMAELEKRVNTDCKVAFAMYPTSISELFAVADAGLLMPPKSTWFEPKLRSGLFIHKI